MRIVFVGASAVSLMAAHMVSEQGHEVVIIDKDDVRLQELTEDLDCGRIHGDGTRPIILREADPAGTDLLFCLTGSDQANIIASLVGRSLGYRRVVTRIDDPGFEHICIELGLEDTIIPSRTIGRFLSDMVEGRDPLELSAMIKDDAGVFSFFARDEEQGPLENLALPEDTRVVCTYRGGRFRPVTSDTKIRTDDEIVLITHRNRISALRDTWSTNRTTSG